ncbi:unnamed protein product [Clonostachys rosea f. rosea IK726]|uniref:Uncharacterized protein n=1 Tax=Clonostachys rosea f. rosea IK726 TaxID=1349383 RepID=A0ACA9UNL5_BIOOC|nr:unnamed protein product [Clonostachys rosea f. rosea IK726]
MSSSGQTTLPPTRRVRKSIGAHTDARKAADKENVTMDLGSNSLAMNRKLRSKSLGPGGLDALKHGNGNRRASIAAPSKPPRSILKTPVNPLPEIPSLNNEGSKKSGADDTLSGSQFDKLNGSKIALRTEEEQQAAAREREERERRDARRKSLANRRVSFAAEATLHTFHDIEYMQDKAASSRRRSSVSNNAGGSGNDRSLGSREQPQVNDEFAEDGGNYDYGRDQDNFSSGAPHFRRDDTGTTGYSSDSEPVDAIEEDIVEEDDGEDSNSDSDDGTMMTMVTEDMTGTSMGSDRTDDRTDAFDDDEGESSTLDEALRLAAHRAGMQRLDDASEEEEEEIIPSFGWIKKGGDQASAKPQNPPPAAATSFEEPSSPVQDGTEMDMDMDMEMTSAVGKILKPNNELPMEEDMSMDVTRAYGGIIEHSGKKQSKQASPEEEDEPMEEATMEFTTAIGGIRNQVLESEESDDNEDMSMELTTIMGGVLGKQKRKSMAASSRRSLAQNTEAGDLTMDMTVGVGRILPQANTDLAGDGEDETMGMDITTAIGGILNKKTDSTLELSQQKPEEDADFLKTPPQKTVPPSRRKSSSPAKRSSPRKAATQTAVENQSPGLSAFRGKGLRHSNAQPLLSLDETPQPSRRSTSRTPSPAKTPTSRALSISSSPLKSAQGSRRSARLSSPEKHSAATTNEKTNSPANLLSTPSSVFRPHTQPQLQSSPLVLTPQRKLTGVGADRNGLGSPRVTALFDRRTSLGEAATEFVPRQGKVVFQDPKEFEDDMHDQENLERRLEAPQEDKNATLNLREMIDSLSPKNNPFKGRKSLHVGSARGLLGKRPIELDEEAELEEQDGVKRLKNHQASPVKNIRLQNPPSKEETAPTLVSPTKNRNQRSPVRVTRFGGIDDETVTSVLDRQDSDENDEEDEMPGDRLHLQDFLNMTSIRFMELTTTKRRQTVAPSILQDGSLSDGRDDLSLERCVVAGACTVPTLELYQHSCRELKKYISEGRRIVKEIETDTFEENPPLFREYISATPEVKALMDNQFKNVKTHARLLSKAMWYEWRMKLQDGLKEGLIRILDDLDTDDKFLQTQANLLRSVLPKMVENYDVLREQAQNLEEAAQELADCDPGELEAARDDLSRLDRDIAAKKKQIAELRKLYEDSEKDVESLTTKKQLCISDIKEAEKIREECRGWTSAEIDVIKARVDAIEAEHGWSVSGIKGTMISMTYRREIELVFDISAFGGSATSLKIDLWYIADSRDTDPLPRTAEKEFFVHCIRNHVCTLAPGRTTVSDVLGVVRLGWDKATKVSSQIKRVNTSFPTTVSKTSDTSVAVCSSLLLVPLATRVEVILNLHGRNSPQGIVVGISPEARVIYGEHFNVSKIGEFLSTKLGETVTMGPEEVWSDVAVELHERLIARGKKA